MCIMALIFCNDDYFPKLTVNFITLITFFLVLMWNSFKEENTYCGLFSPKKKLSVEKLHIKSCITQEQSFSLCLIFAQLS